MDACSAAHPPCSAAVPRALSACAKGVCDDSDEEGGPRPSRPRPRRQVGCRRPLLRDAEEEEVSPDLRRGATALMVAAQAGSLEDVRGLLDEGADVNARDPVLRWSALHWAARERHAGVCAELLRSNADIAIASVDGKTPVQVAAEQDAEFAKVLEAMVWESAPLFRYVL